MRIAESGIPIRTAQSSGLGRTAASASIWQTSERITMTPAWACPARKKFWRSGFSMYPLLLSIRELGVDEPIDYEKTRFEDVVHDVDAVLDTLGGDTQNRSWKVLKKGGI